MSRDSVNRKFVSAVQGIWKACVDCCIEYRLYWNLFLMAGFQEIVTGEETTRKT
jgi:hypothetical protein